MAHANNWASQLSHIWIFAIEIYLFWNVALDIYLLTIFFINDYTPPKNPFLWGYAYRQIWRFPDTLKTYLFLRLSLSVYENGFLDRCVSAIFEFSGNEFELGENKIEREREPIIFSIWQGNLK